MYVIKRYNAVIVNKYMLHKDMEFTEKQLY